jgi:hypothetical protein
MFRFGFFTSSEAVAITSKPIYAKKTVAAPVTIPSNPNGTNGVQFSGLTYPIPAMINRKITPSLIKTITLLNLILSLTPLLTSAVIKRIIIKAGKLISPPCPILGAEARTVGTCRPKPLIND